MNRLVAQINASATRAKLSQMLQPAVAAAIVGMISIGGYELGVKYGLTSSMLTTSFLIATLLAIVYRVVNAVGWNLVLASLGHRTPVLRSVRLWLVSESRRWLPGGVWGYASRAVAAARLNVPLGVATASMALELLVTLAAAVTVGAFGLVFHYQEMADAFRRIMRQQTFCVGEKALWGCVLVILLTGFLGCLLRKKLLNSAAGLIKKVSLLGSVNIGWRKLLIALAYLIGMAFINGLVNQCLVAGLSHEVSVPLLAMVAATAIAWVLGLLAFFSPGGILVREGTLAALLLPWLPYRIGFTLAILSRITQLIAEVVCMLPACFAPSQQAD